MAPSRRSVPRLSPELQEYLASVSTNNERKKPVPASAKTGQGSVDTALLTLGRTLRGSRFLASAIIAGAGASLAMNAATIVQEQPRPTVRVAPTTANTTSLPPALSLILHERNAPTPSWPVPQSLILSMADRAHASVTRQIGLYDATKEAFDGLESAINALDADLQKVNFNDYQSHGLQDVVGKWQTTVKTFDRETQSYRRSPILADETVSSEKVIKDSQSMAEELQQNLTDLAVSFEAHVKTMTRSTIDAFADTISYVVDNFAVIISILADIVALIVGYVQFTRPNRQTT